jgi:hypothetical protein
MSINGHTFFEARKHVGSSGYVLYVHEERDAPRDRKDFETKEELLDYLSAFDLSDTPQQLMHEMSGPPQKDSNPPGRKFIFTGRRKT